MEKILKIEKKDTEVYYGPLLEKCFSRRSHPTQRTLRYSFCFRDSPKTLVIA